MNLSWGEPASCRNLLLLAGGAFASLSFVRLFRSSREREKVEKRGSEIRWLGFSRPRVRVQELELELELGLTGLVLQEGRCRLQFQLVRARR